MFARKDDMTFGFSLPSNWSDFSPTRCRPSSPGRGHRFHTNIDTNRYSYGTNLHFSFGTFTRLQFAKLSCLPPQAADSTGSLGVSVGGRE